MRKTGKKGMAKKVVAVCLSAAMCCAGTVPVVQTPFVYAAEADATSAADAVYEQGALWQLYPGGEENVWYVRNSGNGKFLGRDDNNKIALLDEPFDITLIEKSDGTISLDFGGTKRYLSVGSSYNYSLGEQAYKHTQFYEKVQNGTQVTYQKTSEITAGKEYLLAMAQKNASTSTAQTTTQYALTNVFNDSTSDPRIMPITLTLTETGTDADGTISDENVLASPYVTFRAPEYGKALPDAKVLAAGCTESEVKTETVWSPEAETAGEGIAYQANVKVTAQGNYSFKESQLPKFVSVEGVLTELADGETTLSEDGKTMTISHTFEAITDIRETPEYTVPDNLMASVGTKLGDVTLPEGFSFEESTDTVLEEEGTFTYHLTYTPEDTEHYKTVNGIEIKIKVLANISILTDTGSFWKLEKDEADDRWALLNVRTGMYLGHDEDTESPHISLNNTAEYFEATQNEDGTWHLNFGGSKPHLQVGSGNKFSMGEKEYRTVLFVKKRVGDTIILEKASELKEGEEYVAAMTHRDNDATASAASVLYVLTDQLDPNDGDARILSQKISVTDGKIDVLADADCLNHLRTPQITVTEPVAGEKQKDAEVEIPYTVEGEYTAKTEWTPEGDFEAGKTYQATVTITAAGDHYFTEKEKPAFVFCGGNKVQLNEENVTLVDEKTLKVVIPFEELTATGTVVTEEAEHGTVSVDKTVASSGTTVRIIVSTDENYELKSLKVLHDGQELSLTKVSDKIWEFTMVEGEVRVRAQFAEIKYAITMAEILHGTVTAEAEAGKDRKVLLHVQPDKGYELNKLTVSKNNGLKKIAYEKTAEGYTFVMPGEEVRIRASFRKIDYRISSETKGNGVAAVQDTAQYEENVLIYVASPGNAEITVQDTTNGKELEVYKADDGLYLFTMPDGDVKVSAVFTAKTIQAQESAKAKAATNIKAKATKKGIQIKWKRVTGANGYEIYRSAKKNKGYKKIHVVTKGKTRSYLDKKARKGKTYYYKIRTYKRVNGKKATGSWSKVVTKKC